ncbi:MAG: glycine/sarcosine/betaine reductase selenoprotein B family protein [Roseiflexaceae bacterium]
MNRGDSIRKIVSQSIGWLYSRVPFLARNWGKRFDALDATEVPLVMLRKPLAQCRIALITTGGVHLRSQPGFDMNDSRGDASFRVIPADTALEQITITHDYYDHRDADRDLNILFPIGHVRQLVAAGHIGSLATCYGFMGHIEPPHVARLLEQTAPQVVGMLRQERVDAVFLTPA